MHHSREIYIYILKQMLTVRPCMYCLIFRV
ncbi:MAG: BC10 family protein [Oceanospirillaceae bacterium]|nr:BC10 family protein [Oceanospirillaceae bacterium]